MFHLLLTFFFSILLSAILYCTKCQVTTLLLHAIILQNVVGLSSWLTTDSSSLGPGNLHFSTFLPGPPTFSSAAYCPSTSKCFLLYKGPHLPPQFAAGIDVQTRILQYMQFPSQPFPSFSGLLVVDMLQIEYPGFRTVYLNGRIIPDAIVVSMQHGKIHYYRDLTTQMQMTGPLNFCHICVRSILIFIFEIAQTAAYMPRSLYQKYYTEFINTEFNK